MKSSQGAFQPLFAKLADAADVVLVAGDLTDYGLPEEASLLAKDLAAAKMPTIGVLGNHDFEGGKAVYELNEGGHHDHLVCMQCGRVEEFYDAEIEKRQSKVAKERGFTIREHQLHIYADCTKAACPHRPKG